MKRKNLTLGLGLTVLALCLVFPAQAKEPSRNLEDLTVTAQKREENVQKVPMAIDLFSEQKIKDLGLGEMSEVIMYTPNVLMKSNSAISPIIIRGISSFKGATFSPTGFYVDDVCYPLIYMTNPDLYDIQRIEVLKGPQGTLYGRNTESGLVNIVTRQPDNQVQGEVDFSLGAYDSDNNGLKYQAGANVSGPVIENRLYLGLAVHGLSSDGFRKDLATDEDGVDKQRHLAGRGVLRFTPNEKLDISLTADSSHQDDVFGVFRLIQGPNKTRRQTINSGDPDMDKEESRNSQNLRIAYQGSGWDLVSISSRQDYDIGFTSDVDMAGGPPYALFGFNDTLYSQEIRVTSRQGGPLTWLMGVYGFKEDTETRVNMINSMFRRSFSYWNPVGDIETSGHALFSQVTWHLLRKLHLTVGLRYDHQELSGKVLNNQNKMMPFLPSRLSFSEDLSYDELLPKFALAYDLTENNNLYMSATKGYMTGGYNSLMVMSPDTFTYDPEYSWSYEIGSRNTFLNNRLVINGNLFYVDITDKQIDANNPNARDVPMAPDIQNAGKAHTYGAELNIQADVTPGLVLFGNLGILKTNIDQWRFTSKKGVVDYQGNKLAYAPDYSFDLGARYSHESGLFVAASITGKGDYYGEAANISKQEAFELVNLRTGYESENFDLVLWCKNLFDKEYFTILDEMSSMASGVIKAVEGDPRMVGITLRYRF
jgi:iron complex outermembrane receptor protein